MGDIKIPPRVLPVVGIIFSEGFAVDEAVKRECDRAGEELMRSPVTSFTHTDYYSEEMGDKISRQWIAFKQKFLRLKPTNPL